MKKTSKKVRKDIKDLAALCWQFIPHSPYCTGHAERSYEEIIRRLERHGVRL